MDNTINNSELDISVEVLQLRKQREAIRKKQEEKLKSINNPKPPSVNPYKQEIKSNSSRHPRMGITCQSSNNNVQQIKPIINEFDIPSSAAESKLNSQILIDIPSSVQSKDPCILGIASEINVPFDNLYPFCIQVHLSLIKENSNNHDVIKSSLSYNHSFLINANSSYNSNILICGQTKGNFEAIFNVTIVKPHDSHSITMGNIIASQKLNISASIVEPDIDVVSENSGTVNFDVVPEGCKQTRMVTVINRTLQPVPIKIVISQIQATRSLFVWGENTNLHTISPIVAAYELEPASSGISPTAITFPVTLCAPSLENMNVNFSGLYPLKGGKLQVELDTPDKSTIILATIPFQAQVGKVDLLLQRKSSETKMESYLHEKSVLTMPLFNASTFPLTLSLAISDSENFSISHTRQVVKPNSLLEFQITFTPRKENGEFNTNICVTIEPDGNTIELPIIAICKERPLVKPVIRAHNLLKKSDSEPTRKFALTSTKSKLVFGSVTLGETIYQKFLIKHGWHSPKNIIVSVKGDNAFKLKDEYSEFYKKEIELQPKVEYPLHVIFNPKSVMPYSGIILCKTKFQDDCSKFTIPIQGFGGSGLLDYEKKDLVFDNLYLNSTSVLQFSVSNKGARSIFVKALVFSDEECEELVSTNDIKAQPGEFTLGPNKTKEIIMVANGSRKIMSCDSETIGFVQIITGDEILRKRFKKHKNRSIKKSKINDKSVRLIDWDAKFLGDDTLEIEEDSFPPQAEDTLIFYNSCSKTIIPLKMNMNSDEASITAFDTLAGETTYNFTQDITQDITQDNTQDNTEDDFDSSAPSQDIDKLISEEHLHKNEVQSIISSSKFNLKSRKGTKWDVIPSDLHFSCITTKDNPQHSIFIVNFSPEEQIFEVRLKFLCF